VIKLLNGSYDISIRSLPLPFESKSSLGDCAEIEVLASNYSLFLDQTGHQGEKTRIVKPLLRLRGSQEDQPRGLLVV
jgi:hypothetical protein